MYRIAPRAFLAVLTICAGSAMAQGVAADGAAGVKGDRALMLAYYYTWYTTGFGPHKHWAQWEKATPSELYPQGCKADRIIFPPAIRQITSCAYPLIGPYDSDNPDVVRWHIQLCKAAGIDGFLVDWWGNAHWQKPSGLTRFAFEDVVLPVAEQEGFKVCLFDETPQFYQDLDVTIEWAIRFLSKHKDSPAYLKIDGQPVYCIYQVWGGRLKPDEGRRFIREVEAKVGPVYWIFDRGQAHATGPGDDGLRFRIAPGWERVEEIDAFCMYSTFSSVRLYEETKLTPLFRGFTESVHRLGKKVMLPVHPGLDNRKIQIDEVAAKEGKPHWGIPRDDGRTLRGYLNACKAASADIISITSFNEWPETTIVEPAMTWPDPYQYLKILAEFNGVTWKTPPLPPADKLDPAIRAVLPKAGR